MAAASSPTPAATLLDALQALYHHPDPDIRANANSWLENFQQTIEAWQVSDSLLHESNSSVEVLYFCAQTVRTKIQRDLEELPQNAPLSLRASLLVNDQNLAKATLLIKFRQGPATVRTQLCLAMAALAVQMPAEEWEGGVVKWLGNQLGSHPEAIPALLELLAVLPQEASSYKIAVRPDQRRQFHRELVAAVPDAFNLLTVCVKNGFLDLREKALRAFASWLRLSTGHHGLALAAHPLVAATLAGLDLPQTFDAAVDGVCELIRYTVSGTPVDLAAHMSLVQVIVPKVMALRPRFSAALKAAMQEHKSGQGEDINADDNGPEEDEEITKGMAYLFAEMGESYVDLIATGSSEALLIVEALAEVTSHPSYDIASITFNFWHRLSRSLTSRETYEDFRSSEGESGIEAEKERRLLAFNSTFKLLVALVSFRVTYPLDFESWRKDERADFKETRYAVADLLIDASSVLGGETILQLLAQPLSQVGAEVGNMGSWDWRPVEASLYCIRAIAKAVPVEDSLLPRILSLQLMQIMASLPQLPRQSQLLYTSSLTIAAFADWLGVSPSATALLPSLLELLISALSAGEDPAAAAALALKHVCDACRKQLAGQIVALLNVYRQVITKDSNLQLSSDDELQIVEGLSTVVSALPSSGIPEALAALYVPIVQPLEQVVTAARASGSNQQFSSSQYTISIDRIANVFRFVTDPGHLAEAFIRMWPLFQEVFNQRAADVKTNERLCRAIKYGIRTCGRTLYPFLGTILNEVIRRFRQNQHSCFLYVSSEIVKVFGSDSACSEMLRELMRGLFAQTVSLLTSVQEFTARPDVADDCFLLASRCIRYCPHLLIQSASIPPLIDCAMTGITLQHREASRSILTFLQEIFELPKTSSGKQFRAAIDAVVIPRGPTLTRLLMAALTGALPESRLSEVTYTLMSLARLGGPEIVLWARDALNLIPPTIISEKERVSFAQAISAAGVGTESPTIANSLEELSDVCRRNKRVLQAAQAALEPLRLSSTPQ